MRTRLRTLRSLFPMTGTGFLLLSVSLFSGLGLGVLRADWVFLTMGAFGILLSTLSVAYVGLLGHRIRRQTKHLNSEDTQPTQSVVTGEALNTGFLLPRTSFLFSDFSLRWLDVECQLTIVREGAQFTEQVTFSHRQILKTLNRRCELTDLFGLASVSWTLTESRTIEVFPRPHRLHPPMFQSRLDGEGSFAPSRPRHGDLVDTRPYLPGDPVRSLHWKLFARTGKPIVRVAEPSAREEKRLLLYLVCGPDDEFAAELTLGALQSEDIGGRWEMSVDGAQRVATTLEDAQRLLAASGNLRRSVPEGLERFLDRVSFSPSEHRLLVFAPGQLTPWLEQLRGVLFRVAPCASLTICTENKLLPAVHDVQTPRSFLERWLLTPAPLTSTRAVPDPAPLEALTQAGLRLTIRERPTK